MRGQAIRTLTSPTPVTIHSVSDSDGRRIAEYNETSGALIREYVWNGWGEADQETLQWSVSPPNARARLRGPGVAVIEGGVISFVRTDHIGRPVFATNASGVKTWAATYTPFGGVHTSTGAPLTARFPGQWFQSESGLHQNWMRDYDPTTGRYLQADPLGLIDGASVYGYVKQSPMRFTDPTGQFIPQAGAAAAAFCLSNPFAALACAGAIVYTAYVVTDLCWETYIWLTKPGPGHNGGPHFNDGDDPPPNGPNGPNGPKGPKGPPIPPTWPDLKDPTKDPSKWVETQEQPRLDPKAKDTAIKQRRWMVNNYCSTYQAIWWLVDEGTKRMSIIKRIRSAFQYEQASKLYNGRQYEEALAVLAKIDSTKEMMAKTVLFRANIKYRMHAFLEAEELYRSFTDRDSNQIKSEADRTYLTQYSEFYRDSALRKMGSASEGNVNLSELLSSARQASYLTRSEFVPPTEM